MSDGILSCTMYGVVYFFNILFLLVVLYAAWRLEKFWRPLSSAGRWEYKFLVVGGFLVCGALAWSSSYRLTYLIISAKHLQLLSSLLFFGWAMMCYAVFHHRLLNRKIFVSRKVVYAFVVPSLLATYLLGFGIVLLVMRTFELEMSFVLEWLFLSLGFVAVGLFAYSGKIRRRVQFFISTHFYINKYEYRDEWLALSKELQGVLSESEVVKALQKVLVKSLYTSEIFIWLGDSDSAQDFRLVSSPESVIAKDYKHNLASNGPLVEYLKEHSHFYIKEKQPGPGWQETAQIKKNFFTSFRVTLIAPISIGNRLIGLICLGPEYTGGDYSYDDFDLLTALGSQTASALLAVRRAEKLAHAREQQAWNRLSAFVLHDIKNAATMLSLLQENAPEHIHEPEFQLDMLELVDDALKRMGRVEQRLGALREEVKPDLQCLDLGPFLNHCRRRMKIKLPSLIINVESIEDIQIRCDPELLDSILENLLINAYEEQGEIPFVLIKCSKDHETKQALIEIDDNGPGIADELLPDSLFEPFRTSKEGGSGIGLWQVKRLVASLQGSITAQNNQNGGGRFVIRLPLI
ncbi:MAG: GAF domain-containing protein [Desulfobulbaceae bacterium]|nr:GAF domain-containing protein [Desulfobulbaceae bacterium]